MSTVNHAPSEPTRPFGAVEFETYGVDQIPEAKRSSSPWMFFVILVGQLFVINMLVYGWLPISFGLSAWESVSAVIVGIFVGTVLVCPLALVGSLTGTNNTTASGATFGVRGRLVGSLVGLAIQLVFTALGIWTSGQLIVTLGRRLFGISNSGWAEAVVYAVVTLIVAGIAIYGYRILERIEAITLVVGLVGFVLLIAAFAGGINMSYSGQGDYFLGNFWNTWIFAAVAAGLSGPITLSTIMGDWSRYISPTKHPLRRQVPIMTSAIFLSNAVPAVLGVVVATSFAETASDFFPAVVADSPTWFALVLIPFTFVGAIGFVSAALYSAGLDLDAIVPRLNRAVATALVAVVAAGFVYVGSFLWNLRDSITALSYVLIAITAPWAAVTTAGIFQIRGRYNLYDLQVFNRRETGGEYWFTSGFRPAAVIAWTAGALWGVLAIDATPIYVGPLAHIAGGVDTSFVGSYCIALVVYILFGRRPTKSERIDAE